VKFDIIDNMLSGTISYYVITQEGGSQRDPSATNRLKQIWDTMTPEQREADPRFAGRTRDQLTDRNGQPGDLVAGGEQESTGYEADLVFQPTSNLQILFSYAHNTVETTDAVNQSLIGRIPNSGQIEDQFAFVGKYTFNDGPLDGTYLGLGGQWAGEAFQDYQTDPASGDTVARYNPSTFYLEAFAVITSRSATSTRRSRSTSRTSRRFRSTSAGRPRAPRTSSPPSVTRSRPTSATA
jgi:hypothetical protein